MKRLLLLLAALAVAVGGAAIVGALLPGGHTAVVRARYTQDSATLWAAVSDLGAWPSWNLTVKAMERLPDRDGQPTWVLTDDNGRMTSRVVESVAPSGGAPGRMVTRIDDPELPFSGSWTWELAPADRGTRITLTEEGKISNPLIRLLARLFFSPTSTGESYLRALGAKFGEETAPEILSLTRS